MYITRSIHKKLIAKVQQSSPPIPRVCGNVSKPVSKPNLPKKTTVLKRSKPRSGLNPVISHAGIAVMGFLVCLYTFPSVEIYKRLFFFLMGIFAHGTVLKAINYVYKKVNDLKVTSTYLSWRSSLITAPPIVKPIRGIPTARRANV